MSNQRFTTLQAWLDWQETLHPKSIDLGLERVNQVFQSLAFSPIAKTVITVGGTNGKGSSVALLESIYSAAGHSVGVYTSPHLLKYNERIRINGQMVEDEDLCRAFADIDQSRGDISLSYFEFGTLAAFYLFSQQSLDVVILEVGLGGRLDATNIIDADVALITSIGIDHEQWLGNTRELIAIEKAGILRSQHPAVCGDKNPPASLLAYASEHTVSLDCINQQFHFSVQDEYWQWTNANMTLELLPLPALLGGQQIDNAAAVLQVVDILQEKLAVDLTAIKTGLQSVSLAGRFQYISDSPEVILDVGHNEDAARVTAANLVKYPTHGQIFAVFSMLNDKNIQNIVSILGHYIDAWYVAPLPTERAAEIDQLVANIQAIYAGEAEIKVFESVKAAYNAAYSDCEPEDRILVTGSFFTVAEILALS